MVTKEDAGSLEALIRLLEEFRKEDKDMSLSAALTFLQVARIQLEKSEGASTGDITRCTGMSPSSSSRNLMYLSEWKAKLDPKKGKAPGLNLITMGKNLEQDARMTSAQLQPRGVNLADRLLNLLRSTHNVR
jgi:hypothetical protein